MDVTESVYKLTDVDQIVEVLSNRLQKGIILEDKNFELVTYSSPDEFSFDPVQQKTILTKRCPLFIIERLKREGIIDKLKVENEPIRINAFKDIGLFQRVVVSLKYKNQLYGYLWIYEADESFQEQEFSFITNVANRLGKLLHQAQKDSKHDIQTFIWKLLNAEYVNESEVHRAANIVSYTLPKECTVFVVSVKEPSFLYILTKIKEYFLTNKIAFYLGKGTEIVGIIHGDEALPSTERAAEVLTNMKDLMLDEENDAIIIGIGNSYRKIREVRKSYLEALEVIETMAFMDEQKQDIHFFCDLGILRYIKSMYKKNVSDQYRNTTILKLMEKDIRSNSELVKTLWCYLKNDTKISQTADELFIHPNTLNYRLKQMNELVSIDFTNMSLKLELYTQLYMLHHVSDYADFYKE